MWKEMLWKDFLEFCKNTACGKNAFSAQHLCGKKAVAALGEIPSFHINFP